MGAATADQHEFEFDRTKARLDRLAADAEANPDLEGDIAEYEARKRIACHDGDVRSIVATPSTIIEVETALKAATTAAEILRHLSHLCWFYSHPSVEFPKNQIITLVDLVAWLPQIPHAAISAFWPFIVAAHAGKRVRSGAPVSTPQDQADIENALPGAIELLNREGGEVTIVHLLFPVVTTWQDRVAAREPFNPHQRGSLPRLSKVDDEDHIPWSGFPVGADAPAEPFGQLSLPGFANTVAVPGCTSWLLWLFDRAGGSVAQGHGAPWDMRLWIYAILQLDVKDRDGLWHTLRFPTEEVIGWLHPDGWTNMRRDWKNLPKALNRIRENLSYVLVPGVGQVAILFPSVIPTIPSDPLVEFTIRVPRIAAHGDRILWPLLKAYGAESVRLFRAYLAVTAWLGRSAHRGHPLTRQIAAPVLGPDGKPLRSESGAIIRSKTRYTPNSVARYAGPDLTDHDLARMIGYDETDRRRRHEARFAFERMDDDGVIDLQRNGSRFAIFGPTRNQLQRRKGAAGAAELLHAASNLTDPPTRAKLVDSATAAERRAVAFALRDAPRDRPLNITTLKKAARRLETIPR